MMKHILFTVFFGFSILSSAQDTTNVVVKAPKIFAELANGATYNHENLSIKFIKVLTDSRCPKNVTCIWAGEAEVLVAVLKDGKEVEQKTIKITPITNVDSNLNLIFNSESLKIQGFNLLPYPIAGKDVKAEDYVLQLQVK